MVLESILNPKNAQNKPTHIFIITIIFTIVSVYFSMQLFPENSSILSVALITMILIPFFQKFFVLEEKREILAARRLLKENIISRHKNVIVAFSAFFLGVVVAMSFIYVFFPQYNENIFSLQNDWFKSQGKITGMATDDARFSVFLMNNTQVMVLVFVLSIMFGSGAIFIFTWNASIIAVYIGLFINSIINKGVSSGIAYIYGLPVGLSTIALHGIPEIISYFFAGIAGGILSVGLIREKIHTKEFKKIFKDSLIFLVIAELLIIAAAWLEVVF